MAGVGLGFSAWFVLGQCKQPQKLEVVDMVEDGMDFTSAVVLSGHLWQ